MKLNLKSFIILFLFFVTMATSLWSNNIYILSIFSFATLILLPIRKWWDMISLSLLFFSFFYCFVQYMNALNGIGSGFVFITTLIGPVAFYRFGRWTMEWMNNDQNRLRFLFAFVLCYLSPLFIMTATDIQIGGFINESRALLSDVDGEDRDLAATLYGLMSSVGIGLISALFAKQLKITTKLLFVLVSLLSMVVVVHLVNRTGLVILILCIIFSFIYSTKLQLSNTIYAFVALGLLVFIIQKTGLISSDILNAYQEREIIESNSSADLGGRYILWNQNYYNLLINPFGWHRSQYAHNLWLDMAAVGGWLALIPFLIATLQAIGCFLRILRRPVTTLNLIIATSFVSMFCNAMVEPVIEGSLLFFVLFIMNWGMLKSLSQ